MKNTFVLIFLFSTSLGVGGSFAQTTSEIKTKEPKLVIGFVIDQMRWDYLHRFKNHFGEGGFRRLMREGFNFENAFLNYAPSMTATGHASIYTGAYPAMHGIVGNEWVDRQTGSYTYCTDDFEVKAVGGSSLHGRMSPGNLLATTVGDELKLSRNFKSKVYGISLKDRGGIFPAGRSGDAAYWLDDSTGNFITSSWYMNELPGWVKNFNAQRDIDSMMKKGWNLSLPENSYFPARPDENEFEVPITNSNSTSFPHELKDFIGISYMPFRYTPMGNTLTFNFAKLLVTEEALGKGDVSDMLAVSLSSPDYIGHKFGPLSLEIEDTYARLDKEIASFLNFLDSIVGKENYLLFLTADHGAPPVPYFARSKKLSAGNLNNYGLVKVINASFKNEFQKQDLVTHFYNNQFYLNNHLIDSLNLDRKKIINSVTHFLNKKDEVVMAFEIEKLHETVLPSVFKEQIARGYYAKRCGDIYVILKPQYVDYLGKGTEHGTFYNYDTHIPLIFFGKNIAPGRSFRRVGITDIAPTLSAMLMIQMPNATTGVVLEEVVEIKN